MSPARSSSRSSRVMWFVIPLGAVLLPLQWGGAASRMGENRAWVMEIWGLFREGNSDASREGASRLVPWLLDESAPHDASDWGLGWMLAAEYCPDDIPADRWETALPAAVHALIAADEDQGYALQLVRKRGGLLVESGKALEAWGIYNEVLAATANNPSSAVRRLWPRVGLRRAEAGRVLFRFQEALASIEQSLAACLPTTHDSLRSQLLAARAQIELSRGLVDRASLLAAELRAHLDANPSLRKGEVSLEELQLDVNLALAAQNFEEGARIAEDAMARTAGSKFAPSFGVKLGQALFELEKGDTDRPKRAREVLTESLDDPLLPFSQRGFAEVTLADVALFERDPMRAREVLDAMDARIASRSDSVETSVRARASALRAALAILENAPIDELRARLDELRALYGEFLTDWERNLGREEGIGFLQYGGRRRLVSELIRLHVAIDPERGAEQGLLELVRAQQLGTVTKALTTVAPQLADLLALPRDGEGILVYLVAPDWSHAFAIDRSGIAYQAVEVGETSPLDLAFDFFRVIRNSPVGLGTEREREARLDEWRKRGDTLSKYLLPQKMLTRLAGWREVTVVGTDQIGFSPLEALPYDGATLGRKRAIGHLPSLPLGVHWRTHPAKRPASDVEISFLGAPVYSPGLLERHPTLKPMALDDEGVAEMLAPYVPDQLDVHLGAAATIDRLRLSCGRRPRVLHIWTHGVYESSEERPAALVLSPTPPESDGTFRCRDAGALPGPPLVILSACDAAVGPIRRGDDGTQHLGGAFLHGGAGAVILPTVAIESESAGRLMRVFHRELRGYGVSPAEAMRVARAELAEDPRYADPFYDAFIQVMGNVHEPIFPEAIGMRSRHPFKMIFGGFLLAFVLATSVYIVRLWRQSRTM